MCGVNEACVCRVDVSTCMNRYYRRTQMRGFKKKKAAVGSMYTFWRLNRKINFHRKQMLSIYESQQKSI